MQREEGHRAHPFLSRESGERRGGEETWKKVGHQILVAVRHPPLPRGREASEALSSKSCCFLGCGGPGQEAERL